MLVTYARTFMKHALIFDKTVGRFIARVSYTLTEKRTCLWYRKETNWDQNFFLGKEDQICF